MVSRSSSCCSTNTAHNFFVQREAFRLASFGWVPCWSGICTTGGAHYSEHRRSSPKNHLLIDDAQRVYPSAFVKGAQPGLPSRKSNLPRCSGTSISWPSRNPSHKQAFPWVIRLSVA